MWSICMAVIGTGWEPFCWILCLPWPFISDHYFQPLYLPAGSAYFPTSGCTLQLKALLHHRSHRHPHHHLPQNVCHGPLHTKHCHIRCTGWKGRFLCLEGGNETGMGGHPALPLYAATSPSTSPSAEASPSVSQSVLLPHWCTLWLSVIYNPF